MNSSNGIVPTMELASANGYPMYNNGGFFGGSDGIWGIILLALLFNNGWGGFGGNGVNNIATTDYISSEFTQRDVTNGTQSILTSLSNGFSDAATNLCNVRSDILTGNMGLQNSILSSSNNTQRDILTQTNELNTNLLTTALQNQSKMDECCCSLKAQGIENTQKILDVLSQNTIDDLRSQVNDLKNTITANGIGTNIINQVRPYPIPAYPVSSPYVGLYNGGFYGYNNGFYGNTII
jgi:hypothetical protein